MDYGSDSEGMRRVYDRLTQLEMRGESRDDRLSRLETAIANLNTKMDTVADDVKAAKTGLRIGLWVSTTVLPFGAGVAGWLAHHLWGK